MSRFSNDKPEMGLVAEVFGDSSAKARYGKGAMRRMRQLKREEAEARDKALSPDSPKRRRNRLAAMKLNGGEGTPKKRTRRGKR